MAVTCRGSILAICVLLATAAAARADTSQPQKNATDRVPAGDYTLDKAHASLLFRVNHLGFSHFTGRFTRYDAKLRFDPANPTASSVAVTIDPRSLAVDNPPDGFLDQLRGSQWLDVAKHPAMSFKSTHVERASKGALRIDGELNLHGVSRPVALEATFNGGYAGHPMDPHARIGFSAHGTFKRSQFGIAYGIPAPGSTMGVSDDVEVIIEAEFNGPAWVKPQARTPEPRPPHG